MPGDEMREDATASTDAGRERGGPRHAAPRKPLLTRLHVPAGKAIAMAAMPSAVLMGMGLTPQLASAKPQPKNPFKDGPCVSAPDKEEEAEKAEEKAKAEKAAKEAKEKAEAAAKAKAKREKAAEEAREKAEAKKPDPSGTSGSSDGESGSGSDSGSDSGTDSGSSGDGGADSPEPEPSESEPKNPLDPLGLGDKIKDVLTPGEKAEQEEAEEEREEADKPAAEPSPSAGDESRNPVEDTADKVEKGVEDATDGLRKGAEDAKDKLPKPSPSETGDKSGKDEKDGEDAKDKAGEDEDGKKPFPCVEEKKVAGSDQETPATLPNQPWYLEASSLALHGLDYKGVVNVKMANGESKQALKFTASSLDIGDLHQIVEGQDGAKYHVQAAKGSTSTIRDGQVTMYTERLQGNLFGLIPIVFDPEHPPPVNLPEVFFTKVKVTQAGQFGGTLTVPGLHQSITR
ncbi:hypothetical protein DVA86_25420 [Streptomyces armeniacus]|uniref:Hydrogenase expression protein HypF n=1 Tax=Streptomyces armeniacus TaxID=83291 RepID=A0A345XV27_9ACTN|nr:hypothetical protein [Streptomyces armeniacus]AXK35493.1 hypothetical protein DVA86_25420 [Streptomyces armeniacus]